MFPDSSAFWRNGRRVGWRGGCDTTAMPQPRRLVALGLCSAALLVLIAPTEATAQRPARAFPFDAVLTKSLGFRTGPDTAAPFVLPKPNNYLDAPTRVRIVASTAPVGERGATCTVEYGGKRGYLRCDETSGVTPVPAPATPASAPASTPAPPAPRTTVASTKQFCEGVAECKTFCASACRLDVQGWREGTMNSTCTFSADAIARAGGPRADQVSKIPALANVVADESAVATGDVIEALKRLDQRIASSGASWPAGHVAYVKNCYRPPIEEATRECDFILKAAHLQRKWEGRTPKDAAEAKTRASNLALARQLENPADNLGLTWPGPSPHSRGMACDIVVAKRGERGRMTPTTSCAGSSDATMRAHSKALDEALTNATVGAVRLKYEAWHYEFGRYETTGKSCRCVAPACNDKYWPPNCKDGC